jgi:hypothetical protein
VPLLHFFCDTPASSANKLVIEAHAQRARSYAAVLPTKQWDTAQTAIGLVVFRPGERPLALRRRWGFFVRGDVRVSQPSDLPAGTAVVAVWSAKPAKAPAAPASEHVAHARRRTRLLAKKAAAGM